jgi:hypothetical protein
MPDDLPIAHSYFIAPVPITGEPISTGVFILIDVGAFIAGLLGFCGSWQSAIKGLAQAEQVGFDQSSIAFSWMGGFLEGIVKPFVAIWKAVWDGFFKGLVLYLLHAIQKLHQWLEAKLGPLIKAMQAYRQSMDRLFNTYIKPFLNVVQRIRSFLGVLRFMGIKWAGALDNKLLKIEIDVTSIFMNVRGMLSGMIDILNAVADPMGLMRRPTLVMSLRRVFLSSVQVMTGLPAGYFFPSPSGQTAGTGAPQNGLGFMPVGADPYDPLYNPPPSTYFDGDDGLGDFNGLVAGSYFADDSIDTLEPLDYFNNDLYGAPSCDSPADCLAAAFAQQLKSQVAQGNS